MRHAIGIDLGGTGIYGALVTHEGKVLADAERRTPSDGGPAEVLGTMFAMTRELVDQAPAPVMGIGLGIPGLLDQEAGISLTSPNLNWRNVPVLEPFRQEFGLPVAMENDVRVGCLGEMHFGAGRHFRNFLFTALGTGIGGAVVLDRQIYRGPYGTAGEFGHIPLRPQRGPACGCGAFGCLEALASGPAIRRRTLQALKDNRDGHMSSMRHLPEDEISARTLSEAARGGDALANMLWEEIGGDLGLGILAYYNLLGPEAIIVGGGVSLAGDLLLEPARRICQERLMLGIREHLQIVPAELGDDAGAIGAATLVPGFVAD